MGGGFETSSRGNSVAKGPNEEPWDLKDEQGRPVQPGNLYAENSF